MTEIQDYGSRIGDSRSRRYETFSYLPPMDASEVRRQVSHILSSGWTCAIEHVEPNRAGDSYWYMWKLPLFGMDSTDAVMAELNACRNANPGHHIRLMGYDNRRQTLGLSYVVFPAALDGET